MGRVAITIFKRSDLGPPVATPLTFEDTCSCTMRPCSQPQKVGNLINDDWCWDSLYTLLFLRIEAIGFLTFGLLL